MTLHIRAAGPDDAATLLRFIRELAIYERDPDAVEATEAILRAQLAADRPPFECLLAELESPGPGLESPGPGLGSPGPGLESPGPGRGEPVGFAIYFATYSTWRAMPGIHLEDLFVTPSARGRGVGRALLARLAQITIERGGARLEWAVLDWNELALAFYRALGAKPLEDWITYRLDRDALVALSREP